MGFRSSGRFTLAETYRPFISGVYYTNMNTGPDTTGALTQNVEYAARCEVGSSVTLDRIGIETTTGVADTTIRLGIRHTAANGRPGALLLDAGTVSSASNGFATITIAQAITPGLYWLTATLQGNTGVSVRARTNIDPYIGQDVGISANRSAYQQSGVTAALPADFTFSAYTGVSPKVLVRVA